MFYTNNLADPSKGACKLIHGGSGIPNNGDAYGPSVSYIYINISILTT